MPMARGYVGRHPNPFRLPAGSGQFIPVTVVAELHHGIDADSSIAIIVVVRLPDAAERIDGDHPVIAKVPRQSFELAEVGIAAKDHALLVRLHRLGDGVARHVGQRSPLSILELFAFVAEVEIQLPVWTKHERVDSVVVLDS